jgi:hypothetical protein
METRFFNELAAISACVAGGIILFNIQLSAHGRSYNGLPGLYTNQRNI